MVEVPASVDAEVAVIGAVVTYPETLPEVMELTTDDFYRHEHKVIWDGVMELVTSGKTPEMILLVNALGGKVDKCGGVAYVATVCSQACLPVNIKHYVDVLKDKACGRRLFFMANHVMNSLADSKDYGEIEAHVLTALSKRFDSSSVNLNAVGDVERLLQGEELEGSVCFGFPEVDVATGGIKNGEVCVLAARTSVGKTAAALVSAMAAAKKGWTPLYVSLEMPVNDLWVRCLSYQSNVSLKRFRTANFTDFDVRAIRRAEIDLRSVLKQVRGYYSPGLTPSKLMQVVRFEQVKSGVNYLIIDHAGRMMADGGARSEYESMSQIANGIKNVALNYNIPVLCLWQLNRGVEMRQDKRPTLADLRSSGQAEEIADTILLLYREGYYRKDIAAKDDMVFVDIAKARGTGELGVVLVPWLDFIRRPDESKNIDAAEIPF
jgi:replicative DNA helicase